MVDAWKSSISQTFVRQVVQNLLQFSLIITQSINIFTTSTFNLLQMYTYKGNSNSNSIFEKCTSPLRHVSLLIHIHLFRLIPRNFSPSRNMGKEKHPYVKGTPGILAMSFSLSPEKFWTENKGFCFPSSDSRVSVYPIGVTQSVFRWNLEILRR